VARSPGNTMLYQKWEHFQAAFQLFQLLRRDADQRTNPHGDKLCLHPRRAAHASTLGTRVKVEE
jgi:hypothetical protein